MGTFYDTLQKLVNMSYEEKLNIIVKNYREIYPALCKFEDEPDSDGHIATINILCGAMCADGELEPRETDIFSCGCSHLRY